MESYRAALSISPRQARPLAHSLSQTLCVLKVIDERDFSYFLIIHLFNLARHKMSMHHMPGYSLFNLKCFL